MIYNNAAKAINAGNIRAPVVIGWRPGGWFLYDPCNPPSDVTPEFLCLGTGIMPVPLSEDALDVLNSVIRSVV